MAAYGLRKGGPNLFALAQNAVGLPADQLHQKLRRDLADSTTPLHQAFSADSASVWQCGRQDVAQEFALTNAVSGSKSLPWRT